MPNLLQRILVAAIGIPLLLFAAVGGGWVLVCLIVVLQLAALWEWYRLYGAFGARPNPLGLLLMTSGVDALVFGNGNLSSIAVLMATVSLAFLLEVFRRQRRPLRDLSAVAFFVLYVALPLALWSQFERADGIDRWQPTGALALLFVATWICDTAAYAGGKTFGRHKLDEAASPKKTIEGFVAGLVASFVVLPAAQALRLAEPQGWDYVVFPMVVGVAGQIGDLLESLLKREVQIKDTSAVLPGHGGILDRFDSLLLSTPLLFAYVLLSAG